MSVRSFDLNVEQVLENWEVEHALREVISNALDEQSMTGTPEILIFQDREGNWHIRDFGRGLRIEHFTQRENVDKLTAESGVIGKFGVGLKDALATFHRRKIGVLIGSAFGTYRLKTEHKTGFDNIITLHVEYNDARLPMQGTEFVISGATEEHMAKARALFLRFNAEEVVEAGTYGQILRRRDGPAKVYISGVMASEEPNFLFSYNITSLTDAMRKRLNRERSNVGRTTYADRVKAILRGASSQAVKDALIEQVSRRASGDQCDEMSWIEISQMALNLMNENRRVVFFTEQQLSELPDIVSSAEADNYEVVVVSQKQYEKLMLQAATGGPEVRTVGVFVTEFNSSFQYTFVDQQSLTEDERRIYALWPQIADLIGMSSRSVPAIRVSETMRLGGSDTAGVWDPAINAIVIRRDCLLSVERFGGVLLHEIAHVTSGAMDASRPFEYRLTQYMGMLVVRAFLRQNTEIDLGVNLSGWTV